jgi:hypothetical protein
MRVRAKLQAEEQQKASFFFRPGSADQAPAN